MCESSSDESLAFSDIRSGLPAQLDDMVRLNISPGNLSILSIYAISVLEIPFSVSLWLIIIEVALEEGAVWIQPFSLGHLSTSPGSNVFHASLFENISTLAVFLSFFPLSGIDIFIIIYHDSFSVSFTLFPMAVILSYSCVGLLAYTVFIIFEPSSFVSISWNFFFSFSWFFLRVESVCSITLSYL